jgi:dihydroorotase
MPGANDEKGSSRSRSDSFKRADLRITGDTISDIAEELEDHPDDIVIEANNMWLVPGFIDVHTHLRDLGQTAKEDIDSGTKAAARGGYTTVVAMANTVPPIDSPLVFEQVLGACKARAQIRVLPLACVTMAMKGEQLTEMATLSQMGAIAFSDDGMPVSNLAVMKRALEYAKLLGKPIISHPEDHNLTAGGCMNESAQSTRLGLPGIPNVSESACIAREIELDVSTEAAVGLIRQGKAEGLPITAEVSPHHLSLCDEDVGQYDTHFKMNPPLRSKHDQFILVEAIKEGLFDCIATDHAPHTRQEKSQPFTSAPFGIIGLETAFAVVYERLVLANEITINELVGLLTIGPARVIGLPDPSLKVGARADIAVIAPHMEWIYNADAGASKSNNSPWNSRTLTGKVLATICGGQLAYRGTDLKLKEPKTVG